MGCCVEFMLCCIEDCELELERFEFEVEQDDEEELERELYGVFGW